MNKKSSFKILVLSSLLESTGNATTAYRISSELRDTHDITLVNINTTDIKTLKKIVIDKKIDAAIGLHALLAGPLLHALNIPYALILGGTDLYQKTDHHLFKEMVKAVLGASKIIAFGEENLHKAYNLWPEITEKGICIAQAVSVKEIDKHFLIRDQLALPKSAQLAILPAGMRKVKDPFFLVQACHELHLIDNNFHLCLVGPILDHEFAQAPLNRIQLLAGIHHIHELPRPQILAAIQQANITLNSSLSEGMSSAILESMALHTPVVARANDGNLSIVKHEHTGFIYTEANEAINLIKMILKSDKLIQKIDANCQHFIKERHCISKESALYNKVITSLMKDK